MDMAKVTRAPLDSYRRPGSLTQSKDALWQVVMGRCSPESLQKQSDFGKELGKKNRFEANMLNEKHSLLQEDLSV